MAASQLFNKTVLSSLAFAYVIMKKSGRAAHDINLTVMIRLKVTS